MFLIICVILFTGCRPSQTTPDSMQKEEPAKMPKALFLYFYYNGDYYEVAKYIDDMGNVHTIDISSEEQRLTIKEFYERVNQSKDEILYRVDEEQLNSNYQLFLQVPIESGEKENLIYTESIEDVVYGKHRWYGFRYNKKGELEHIVLAGEGDTSVINQDKTAQEIETWLRGILIKYDIYN